MIPCSVIRENGTLKVETHQARDQSGWQCGHAILQATEEGEGNGKARMRPRCSENTNGKYRTRTRERQVQ